MNLQMEKRKNGKRKKEKKKIRKISINELISNIILCYICKYLISERALVKYYCTSQIRNFVILF